jgi:tRNA A-37 threonylcarbamoyl transferase component Bud32
MGVCLSQELIELYTAGTCSGDELRAIEVHLAECESCREQTESARRTITSAAKPNSSRLSPGTPDHSIERTLALDDEQPVRPVSEPRKSPDHRLFHSEPIEKTRLLEDEHASTLPSGRGPAAPTEQTLSLDDVSPGQAASQLTTFPPDGQNFAKALESMIDGYEVLEEMPRGGQAAVYKAIHTATKTKVAIKVLLPTLLASARARHYFEREAELIASLDHPNIVSIRDSGIIHHQYYFVMQYVDGQPLGRYVRLHKLSFREIVVLFNKICAAITYAHQQGVIHRDLKFANILVDRRGEPHVLDFGLAKATGLSEKSPDKALATMTGQLSGTLSTMSPEQAAGRPDRIDVRTDVYSLGVMLYHMLTGQYPYDVSGSTLEALQNIQKVDPIRPRQLDRKFDSDVEAILLTALAKDPAERYQSAAELQSDIQHWLDGRPIRVKSISTMYLLRKIIVRHRYSSTVAALLLLIILGFAYTCFDLYLTAEKARKEQEEYAVRLTAQTETANALRRPLVFTCFLNAWSRGNRPLAALVLNFLSEGSKERQAAGFLINSKSVAEKEAGFRQGLSEKDGWFADFIVGENHRKNGSQKEAIEAYRRSYEAIRQSSQDDNQSVDGLLVEQVKQRLDELDAVNKPTEQGEEPQTEK